ncbi:MAG: 4-hydroxythreonine-4-phosphate dehydrogenase PdxA, partial [Melioribacteraceae bacterium]|nr:4-hydroxythreonine-4-phosphate dehydrogenase PdxA [Melioribacteraceae bacterium]
MITVAVTCGDINGIGPEIAIKAMAALDDDQTKFIFCLPENVYRTYRKTSLSDFQIFDEETTTESRKNQVLLFDRCEQKIGSSTFESGAASFLSIKKCFELVVSKKADAMVTAPISKTALNLARIDFPGHTEMLGEWTNTKEYLMLFYSNEFLSAPLTIHLPLLRVAGNITKMKLKSALKVAASSLLNDFGIKDARIAVLGLNPHAGENGLIGEEELEIITPVIEDFNTKNVEGPFVADAFFGQKLYKNYDLILGMYHDQVLIPFKMLNFESGVNFTAGLPIIRTSPDHGTAFNIAGKNIANPTSMIEAIKL